jgi:hypothetical protein
MFEGFTPEDFDAYLEEKWASNMFTLPRRRVKEKLETLGKALSEELSTAGLVLLPRLSDEHPSLWNNKKVDTQWLFFSRDEEAQNKLSEIIDTERTLAATVADPTPLYRQVFLGVSLDRANLEVGLRLHYDAWVDRKNLLKLVGSEEGRARFAELRGSLPDHYEIGVAGEEMMAPRDLDDEAFAACAARLEEQGGWLFIGARMPRDQVAVLGADVAETALETFRLLIPVYRFVAWSPDNDAISMDRLVAEREQAIKASQAELDRERAEREAKRREQQALQAELRAEVEDRVLQEQAWRKREIAARRAAAAKSAAEKAEEAWAALQGPPSPPQDAGASEDSPSTVQPDSTSDMKIPPKPRSSGAKADSVGAPKDERSRSRRTDNRPASPARRAAQGSPRSKSGRPKPYRDRRPPRPRETIDADAEVAVGARVEVLRGFLKGRRGVVQDIDEKGQVKIAFGALSSRLARADVAALKPEGG